MWNGVILSRPKANAKLLLHEEKAEYGSEINDSVQESEDFVFSFSGNSGIHFSVFLTDLCCLKCLGENRFEEATQNSEFIMEGFHLSKMVTSGYSD